MNRYFGGSLGILPKTKAKKPRNLLLSSPEFFHDVPSTLGLSGIYAREQEEADLLGRSGK
jgi:hypothetical protein